MIMVVKVVYKIAEIENVPCPKNEYLNVSKMVVIGFSSIKNLNFFGAAESGYATVVLNINNWIPKFTNNAKSLYFVVNDDIINPNPWPKAAIKISK